MEVLEAVIEGLCDLSPDVIGFGEPDEGGEA
jgi:hypothetical protein